MEKKNIKNIVRGHLYSLYIKPKKLKKFGDEFYKTRHYDIIISNFLMSFKQRDKIFKIKYDDVTRFYLKDSKILVIFIKTETKKSIRLEFNISKPINNSN